MPFSVNVEFCYLYFMFSKSHHLIYLFLWLCIAALFSSCKGDLTPHALQHLTVKKEDAIKAFEASFFKQHIWHQTIDSSYKTHHLEWKGNCLYDLDTKEQVCCMERNFNKPKGVVIGDVNLDGMDDALVGFSETNTDSINHWHNCFYALFLNDGKQLNYKLVYAYPCNPYGKHEVIDSIADGYIYTRFLLDDGLTDTPSLEVTDMAAYVYRNGNLDHFKR
jgi:hypothetical protein